MSTVDKALSMSSGEVLQILGTGPPGAILMALGAKPLQTKELTQKVNHYAPRTVYRHVARLAKLGWVERREEPGAPPRVIYNLSYRRGQDLVRLLDAYVSSALSRNPAGNVDDVEWTKLGLLGELWESGWVAKLSAKTHSPTELAEMTPGLTFHQANHRARLFLAQGLLCQGNSRGRGVLYGLDRQARTGMGLVAGIGRWRKRHWDAAGERGMTGEEMATILRVTVPLVEIPMDAKTSLRLSIVDTAGNGDGVGSEDLLIKAEADGAVRCRRDDGVSPDAWAVGTVNTWLSALLDDNRGRMRVGGDLNLIDAYLIQLHRVLWNKQEPTQGS